MALNNSYTDEQLLQLMQDGSGEAFTELYKRHWPSVYRNAMRLLRSRADAEDVVQQLFESIWNRRSRLDIRGSFAAYLFTGARYSAIHLVEKNIEKYACVSSLAADLEKNAHPSIESGMDAKALEITIDGIVDTLPVRMKEVFLLSRKENLTHKEIAERLNISEETVKKQVYNALKLIRQHLGKSVSLGCLIVLLYGCCK